ncbi:MAG: hypothetical protein B0D91_12685 [Oceanospirillales bacterium LUC14_002_19_P2]|nr:MAG: hypothetical protein B0D91_12685 [Oceanospirillales bacterium LUC14_002_19_P2]
MNLDINRGLTGISYVSDTSELPDLGASRKTSVSTANSYSVADNVGDALGYDNQDKKLADFARNTVRHQYNVSEHKDNLKATKEFLNDVLNSDIDIPEDAKDKLKNMLAEIEHDELLFQDAQMRGLVLIAV